MAQQQQQESPPQAISFVHQITSRDGTLLQDSKMVNCYPEQTEMGPAVVKRPGLSLFNAGPVGRGQGIFNFGDSSLVFTAGLTPYAAAAPSTTYPFSGTVPLATQPFFAVEGPFLTGVSGVVKQSRAMWLCNNTGNPLTQGFSSVTDANYPGITAPGVVSLDYTTYVLDQLGNVRGSNLNDASAWPALNSIKVDQTLGPGVGIHRHLSYLLAFCDRGIQFFYDAGNPTGSPLGAVPNGTYRTGCVTGFSIAELDDVTYFMGKSSSSKGRAVFAIDGLQLTEVSNPHINKLLTGLAITNDLETAPCKAYGMKAGGHSFYVLNLINANLTLVYDATYKHWHVWTSTVAGVEQFFLGGHANASSDPTTAAQNYVQDYTTGAVYTISDLVYQDNSGSIAARIVTKPYDWGTMRRKFFQGMYLLADTCASTLSVRYSDDDYTTFSTFRTIDLSRIKKFLLRIGSSRRRSWEFLHTANTPLKLYSAEVPFEVGE